MKVTDLVRLTSLGLFLFPLRPKTKEPFKDFAWVSESSNKMTTILGWRRQAKANGIDPDSLNWGVHCGKSELVVLDIDLKKWKKDDQGNIIPNPNFINGKENLKILENEFGEVDKTWVVESPNEGLHIYLSGYCGCGEIKKAVDVRSVGEYVVAPFCEINKDDGSGVGSYQIVSGFDSSVELPECPSWISEHRPVVKKDAKSTIPLVDLDLPHNEQRVVEYLKYAEPSIKKSGGNQTAYKVAARVKDLGVSQETAVSLMTKYWYYKCTPNNKPSFVERIVAHVYKYGQNRPGSATPEAAFETVEGALQTRQQAQSKRDVDLFHEKETDDYNDPWDLDNVNDDLCSIAVEEIPPKKLILDPWLESGEAVMVFGARNSGKTWFILGIIKAVRSGEGFGPWKCGTEKVNVAYFDGETAKFDLQDRIRNMGMDNLDGCWIYSNKALLREGKPPGALDNPEWRYSVSRQLIKRNIKLVIFDNLASFTTDVDENSSKDFSPIRLWFNQLTAKDIAVIYVHHTGKDVKSQRGSSAHEDNIDTSILLQKVESFSDPENNTAFDIIFTKDRVYNMDKPRINGWRCKVMQESGWNPLLQKDAAITTKLLLERPRDNMETDIIKMALEGTTQSDMAQFLNISKTKVGSVLKRLCNAGEPEKGILIQVKRGVYELTDKGRKQFLEEVQ